MKRIVIILIGLIVAVAGSLAFKGFSIQKAPQYSSEGVGIVTPEFKAPLEKNLVCMVNDTYFNKEQILVEVDNKKYYGCCDMCVETLNKKREIRYAKDPLTGEEVDKALAFIAINPKVAGGKVLYFSDQENYQKYMSTLNI